MKSRPYFTQLQVRLQKNYKTRKYFKNYSFFIFIKQRLSIITNSFWIKFHIFFENKYILLCKCYYEMRQTKLKQKKQGFYIIILQKKNENFFNKDKLIEQRGFLLIVQNCNNQELNCILQIDKRQIITKLDKEQFYNSIIIMNNNLSSEQTNIVKIYEEKYMYFLFMKYSKFQLLESLLLHDFQFRVASLVCIIYLILQNFLKYKNSGIYHGNINFKSIYINMSGAFLQIIILFPKYLKNNNKSISLDLLNLGQLLYQITFYEIKDKIKQFLDLKLITQQKQLFQHMNTENKRFKFLFRISQ
ncbi:unnamed protein product [Paramecium sonneborni]|uniref:Uncharacterized protein n=1 Tax=Paramecium sonneborni TaxID=65129 RepID=A0A8S1N5F2_9CILI|nr:unnamed protein product [Paramecium sonneborni]